CASSGDRGRTDYAEQFF
nr:T-cell receptor V beta CDR3 region {clone V8In32} [mice, NOD, islets, Peptide Partial, 17 aa] [Mus sp.]